MLKQNFLDVAEIVDAYRVFPRLYLIVFLYILWDVHSFLKTTIPPESAHLYGNMVWGAVGAMTGFYVATGRKWLG